MNRRLDVSSQQGFSLLELLVVVAIIAILSAIAYSSYIDQVVRSRRAAGAACLQERAQFMERFYTTNLSYLDGDGNPPAIVQCDAEVSPFYQIGYEGDPTATTFTLEAVPQDVQAERDTQCGTLRLNHQGSRTTSNDETPAEDCW